ncbi:uncharacterized protein LOC100902896 [Galendromus occidentalis]|uniref:Uncharacterized protein LOC100902896 n=1 Tax=Galendromus occidentalis TaxID=34638 RepID=A0AAJ6QVZ8_9ACAR|nr:uncharacterized protein LOC100902896 [Galendromus occidentalis]
MAQPTTSKFVLILESLYLSSLIGHALAQSPSTPSRTSKVPINPCEFQDPDYAFGMTACAWRELPQSMTSRFNNRFKELVGLDDDGVFNLLCKSIDYQGDVLVEAFAREYAEEKEQNLFLETVLKCHDEVLANGNIQASAQVKSGGKKPQSASRSPTKRRPTTDS